MFLQHYGIRATVLKASEDYLTGRSRLVKINELVSGFGKLGVVLVEYWQILLDIFLGL